MADAFKALADGTRGLLRDELAARDRQSLFEICSLLLMRHGVDASRQAISQHLAVLESAGLAKCDGRDTRSCTASTANPSQTSASDG